MKTLFRKFLVKKDGVAAIEFAILAPVFFTMMSGMLEISYFIYSNTSVQRAVENVIYDMRTGNIYAELVAAGNIPPEQWYKEKICSEISIPDCYNNVKITTQKYDATYTAFGNSDTTGVFDVGASGILMRMEAAVTVPSIILTEAIFGADALTITGGLTFMTEPY